MVRVIKEGSLTKCTTCKKCKSELEYEPADVKSIHYEESPTVYYIECPTCCSKLGANFCSVYVDDPAKTPKEPSR